MTATVHKRFSRIIRASSAAIFVVALVGVAWGQQNVPSPGTRREEAREKAKDKIQSARETKQGAREATRDAREGARDTAREDRQTTRDARAESRDTVRDDRQTIREARRDVRRARREFIASRIRSGDLGLFLRRAANRLTVTDVAGQGVIAQTGLKEGDEIISVNGQPVSSEREFVDQLFADQAGNKPVQVEIIRNGQQQSIAIQPKAFIDEHMASDNKLEDFGLIMDENDPNHVKVKAIIPRSPAFYAGVRSGDQITGFNGQRIAAVADLIKSIANISGGTTSAPVEVNRNNQTRQLEIEIPDEREAEQTRTVLRPTLPDSTQPNSAPPLINNNTAQPPPAPQSRLNPPR